MEKIHRVGNNGYVFGMDEAVYIADDNIAGKREELS